MSRLLDPAQPIEVRRDKHGDPVWIGWQRGQKVLEINRYWRIDDEWWRKEISRMYYELVVPIGLVEVYQDLLTGEWFLERLHD
ncbi:MAG: hypothetical protein M3P51_06720 [Chloroflexota bacterium]|nr:hypothetical protein [Chloroflexota bacterium]